jgi:transposase InsO family protein
VKPETVVGWHRAGFRLFWRWRSRDGGRWRIGHVAVTAHPTAAWTSQQLREAFPFDTAPRFLHRDRDSIYGDGVIATIEAMGVEDVPSAPHSPWQNPYAERLVGSIRRELLDRVVIFDERHAVRLLREYQTYFNDSRTHPSIATDPRRTASSRLPLRRVGAARSGLSASSGR